MRRILVALALSTIPATALAVSESWFHDGAGEVEIAGAVEVPLYRGEVTHALPSVLIEVPAPPAEEGEEVATPTRVFAVVDLVADWSKASESTVKALGGKVKKSKLHGAATKIATIPEVHIGDVVIRGLRVQVDDSVSTLSLGISTLGIGAAILPSQGVVKLVPAEEAAGLVSSVGTAQDITWVEGKWFELGRKVYGDGLTGLIDGKLLGAEGKVRVDTASTKSQFSAVPQPEELRIQGARAYVWCAPEVSGVELPASWLERNQSLIDPEGATIGSIGYDLLYTLDIAIDPAGPSLAVAEAEGIEWTATRDIELEQAEQAYAKATEAPEDEEDAAKKEESEDEGGPDKGDSAVVGYETAYASALWSFGQEDEALEHYGLAVEAAGDSCGPYQTYGRHLVAVGQVEEALPHLQKAGELWDRWYAQDLKTRQKVADGKKVDADFALKQDTVCHEAWGDLALAKLALGDAAAVAELYDTKVDLDSSLPRAYGLSLIKQGKADKANGPLRRAMNMRVIAEPTDHVALATAHATADKQVVFDRQLERVQSFSEGDLTNYMALGEAARSEGGDARAAEVVQAMLERDPHSLQSQLFQAIELTKRARSPKAKKELKALIPELKASLDHYCLSHAHSASAMEYRALFKGLAGDAEGGLEILQKVDDNYATTDFHLAVKAMLYDLLGDADKSAEARELAAMSDPHLPMAALGLITELGGGPRIKLQADRIELFENVLFVPGEATIIEDSWPLLEEIQSLLAEHAEIVKVEVAGHTDDQGDDASNLKLSEARAAAVMAWLVEHGIDEARLEAKGYGETEPVADNETTEGRQQNRRVEFKIVEKK